MTSYPSDEVLFKLDQDLERLSSPRLSDILKTAPGMRWTDELPLPHYDHLAHTSSTRYLSHAWSLPARQAWLSIRQKPRLPVLEALALRVPGAWRWRSVAAVELQPAVWAGAAFVRDSRKKAPQVLADVLDQALEGAQTSQERAERAAAIMGGVGPWRPVCWAIGVPQAGKQPGRGVPSRSGF